MSQYLDEYADTKIAVDGQAGCLAALAKLKETNPHLKTVLSVGGGAGSKEFPVFTAKADGLTNFARSAKEWVIKHSMDGIDSKLLPLAVEQLPSPPETDMSGVSS